MGIGIAAAADGRTGGPLSFQFLISMLIKSCAFVGFVAWAYEDSAARACILANGYREMRAPA